MARPRTGHEKLDTGRILDTALGIVDSEGIDALSMRRLGKELGVDPMAIYHHLPGKQAIITGLVQRVFEEVPRSTGSVDSADWRERVRHWAVSYCDVARRHANLIVHLVSNVDAVTESVMRANEELYAALDASGMSPRDVARSADMIVDYTHGVILGEVSKPPSDTDWRTLFRERPRAAPPGELDTIRRVFESLEEGSVRVDYEFGLDVIITGLQARIGRNA